MIQAREGQQTKQRLVDVISLHSGKRPSEVEQVGRSVFFFLAKYTNTTNLSMVHGPRDLCTHVLALYPRSYLWQMFEKGNYYMPASEAVEFGLVDGIEPPKPRMGKDGAKEAPKKTAPPVVIEAATVQVYKR